MAFLIGGANSDSGAYQIDNSLRFSDSNYLTIDNTDESGEGVNFTLSVWLKMTSYAVGGYQGIFSVFKDSNDYFEIYKDNSEKLQICQNINGTNVCYQNQGFAFHDYSAWYHLVVSFNNSASGEVNKIKVYINGAEISSSEGVTNSNPFADMGLGDSAYDTRIGAYRDNTSATWNGYMAELHLVAGTTLTASSFGETDDNGVWIPIKYTGSYGENGFFLEFQETGTSQNASGMGADTSGNGNHLTPSNLTAQDVTTDTPTNNFCTMNPLYSYSGIGFKDGNLEIELGGSNHRWGTSTFFVANGKWYFECKLLSDSNYNSGPGVIAYGIDDPITTEGGGAGSKAEGWIYLSTSAGDLQHGGTQYGTASAATTNDILMVAFDVDNGKIWIGKNGTWSEGSNPSTGNGAVREDLGDASSGLFSPGVSGYAENMVFNFGNPTFSGTDKSDANGYGSFEYEPPSGFYSLCTKNLAEFG